MKNLLTSKAGVTVLEGIVALGLLALIAGGAFAVLLAASRQTSQPDIREEMVLAVEKASHLIKAYVGVANIGVDPVPPALQNGLCGCSDAKECTPQITDGHPLAESSHDIRCLLPPICDKSSSTFTYEVGRFAIYAGSNFTDQGIKDGVNFQITCNGYTL